jgi:membrane protease subunit HflK
MPAPQREPPPPRESVLHKPLRWIWRLLPVVLIVWFLFSSFVTIPADSVGVCTRFGRFNDILQPGLRFRLPFGMDQVDKVPVQRQLKLEFGFASPNRTNPFQASTEPQAEQSMVTGDLNMAMVEWVVQYRVDDARLYLFHARDPALILRDASESAMREVVGDRTVDEVITIGRQDIEHAALLQLQDLAKRYGLGMSVLLVQLKNGHPPQPVQASFNEVNQAQQEKQQSINVANGEYNRAVPRARGEAARKISEAQGYATKRTNEARGDAERFSSVLAEYLKAPDVTRQRLYHETMKEVLPRLERKVILDEKAHQILPLFQLGPEPSKTR